MKIKYRLQEQDLQKKTSIWNNMSKHEDYCILRLLYVTITVMIYKKGDRC